MPNRDGTPTYVELIRERDSRLKAEADAIRDRHDEQMKFQRELEERQQRDREIQVERDRQHGGKSRSLSASDLMWGILILAIIFAVF